MEALPRRGLLKLLLGAGAAAACGMTVAGPAEAKDAVGQPVPAPQPGETAQAVAETVEPELQPDQYYFVRRRRFYRRRTYFVRPRRVYYYRRPRYRVIRFYRRRW